MNDNKIRDYLVENPRKIRSRDEFWMEFSKRAADIPQGSFRTKRAMLIKSWMSFGAAAAAVLVMALTFYTGVDAPCLSSEIVSYQVSENMRHDGVMILHDEESNASILWVVDADDGDEGDLT